MERPSGSISDLWFTARPWILIILLMGASVYTNEAVIEYRMREFNRSMENISKRYNQSNSLNMLARFEAIRKSKDVPEDDEAGIEIRLRGLAVDRLLRSNSDKPPGIRDQVIGAVISVVRFLLGKKAEEAVVNTQARRELEVGYVFEQSRKYDKAVIAYSRVLEHGKTGSEVAATLLLHRGYCLTLLGEYPRAEADFRRVISVDPGEDEKRTASRFLEILKALQEELRLAKASKQSPLAYGRRLFQLANYAGALEELGKLLSQNLSVADRFEGRFLHARSQEELGFDSLAVPAYRALIKELPESAIARKAGRRLYLLGKIYTNDKDLEKEALQQIRKYQDMGFIDRLKNLTRTQLPENRKTPSGIQVGLAGLSAPNQTDALEKMTEDSLSGQMAAVRVQTRDEEVRGGELPKANPIIKTEKAQHSNARRIQADPMRREAILQVLSGNKGELEFLYQKWLRKGAVFEGNLAVRMLIAPSGDVREAKVVSEKSDITHAGFITDILQNVRRWKFREDPGTRDDLPVTFPLKFVDKE